jgi:hypothetical protein
LPEIVAQIIGDQQGATRAEKHCSAILANHGKSIDGESSSHISADLCELCSKKLRSWR